MAITGGITGRELSDRLDNLIQFAYTSKYGKSIIESAQRRWIKARLSERTKTTSQYPKSVVESVWRKLQKAKLKNLSLKLDELIEFADPRPRNPLGEFSPQGEGGPDPNAMATVYKLPQIQPQVHAGPGIPKLAGAALIGGALGQVGGNIGKEGWAGMAKLVKHLSGQAKKIRR